MILVITEYTSEIVCQRNVNFLNHFLRAQCADKHIYGKLNSNFFSWNFTLFELKSSAIVEYVYNLGSLLTKQLNKFFEKLCN